jgi:hypothetical protein
MAMARSSGGVVTRKNRKLTSIFKSSPSFDLDPNAYNDSPVFVRPPPAAFSPLRQPLATVVEDEEDDDCWLAELTEPEEAEVKPKGRRDKERSRSFDCVLLSTPRNKTRTIEEAPQPKRLSLTYGAAELSKALEALRSLDTDSGSDGELSPGGTTSTSSSKSKRRAMHRGGSILSLLRRRATDKGTR